MYDSKVIHMIQVACLDLNRKLCGSNTYATVYVAVAFCFCVIKVG